jgi:hypothetical protein
LFRSLEKNQLAILETKIPPTLQIHSEKSNYFSEPLQIN